MIPLDPLPSRRFATGSCSVGVVKTLGARLEYIQRVASLDLPLDLGVQVSRSKEAQEKVELEAVLAFDDVDLPSIRC